MKPDKRDMYDVIIVGGGVGGLINANLLASKGWQVILFEKKSYPFHRVCGEYVSNEVVSFLKQTGCYPEELYPAQITRFQLTSTNGKSAEIPLDLGGFGISRYSFDPFLAAQASSRGAEIIENASVQHIQFIKDYFEVKLSKDAVYRSRVVIGAFGKRSNLDSFLNRRFFKKRSPYIGVKYHIRGDFDNNLICLHNFHGGYCGISKIEDDTFNLCYLSLRAPLKKLGTVHKLEEEILMQNPFLYHIFNTATFVFDKPVVINEISFATKDPVCDHILMSGDAAGMITPLCGNGMAMAIHSASILSEQVHRFLSGQTNRSDLEYRYSLLWRNKFGLRLLVGRQIQNLFGTSVLSNLAVSLIKKSGSLSEWIMKQTHGKSF